MNSKVVSAICFRLFALYLCVSVIISLPSVWGIYMSLPLMMPDLEPNIWVPVCMSVATFLLGVAAVLVLWKVSSSILNKLPDNDIADRLSLRTGYNLLGVFFIISGLAYLPSAVIQSWRVSFSEQADFWSYAQYLAEPLVLIVAGVVISDVYKKIKYAGL